MPSPRLCRSPRAGFPHQPSLPASLLLQHRAGHAGAGTGVSSALKLLARQDSVLAGGQKLLYLRGSAAGAPPSSLHRGVEVPGHAQEVPGMGMEVVTPKLCPDMRGAARGTDQPSSQRCFGWSSSAHSDLLLSPAVFSGASSQAVPAQPIPAPTLCPSCSLTAPLRIAIMKTRPKMR